MHDKRWILSGNRSWPDMDRDTIWMDDQHGSQEMDHVRRMTINLLSFMRILRLVEVVPFSRSLTLIIGSKVSIMSGFGDIECSSRIVQPSKIPSSTQRTNQRSSFTQLQHRYRRV